MRISLFAFDPDNPSFEPKVRLTPTSIASGPDTTAPTVTYQVTGLPAGATFDSETLELVWTPGNQQAGTYNVTVTATDDGNPSTGSGQVPGSPLTSQVIIPIVVRNANRAPEIADITNAFVDKGAVLEIPVSAVDADGNPLQLTFAGLPRFATYTQNPSADGAASGVLRFAPVTGDRGDYAITVIAQDNGDGDINQVLSQAKSFVLTVRSASEAPVINAPKQVVVVVGQTISLPVSVSDADQDALTFSAQGLPTGATLSPQTMYGQALLAWTPTAADIGTHDISVQVTDSGLGPQDAGYIQDPNAVLVPNSVAQTVRVIVRAANAAPELLGVQVNGTPATVTAGTATQVAAKEGTPLTIELSGHDTDLDWLNWTVADMPRGMILDAQNGSSGGSSLTLRWTPTLFAAQDSNIIGGQAGHYSFTVKASDGAAEVLHTFEVVVANTNQAPVILPMPLQLVNEGDTIGFTVLGADADGNSFTLGLMHDANTPTGVNFDPKTGYFEWTPGQDIVNNATPHPNPLPQAGEGANGAGAAQPLNDAPYTFTFSASDGEVTTIRTVQVRVFDVNRVPQISSNEIGDRPRLSASI